VKSVLEEAGELKKASIFGTEGVGNISINSVWDIVMIIIVGVFKGF